MRITNWASYFLQTLILCRNLRKLRLVVSPSRWYGPEPRFFHPQRSGEVELAYTFDPFPVSRGIWKIGYSMLYINRVWLLRSRFFQLSVNDQSPVEKVSIAIGVKNSRNLSKNLS